MGKGGKGGGGAPQQPTNQTITQTNLPEYARPYFEDILKRGQAQSNQQYQTYGGERIAGMTPQEQTVQSEALGMDTPGQFGSATGLATQAGLGSIAAGQYNPSQFNAQQIGTPELQQFQMDAPQQFGQAQADQYMSPYMQSVVDVQKQRAMEDAQKGQLSQNLAAARQGTYGGARQTLAMTEREKALQQQLGEIQATGSQTAFQQAQQQFDRDRAAGMTAGQQNLQAQLGVQQLGAQTGMQAAQANQQAALDAQRLAEQSRQFGGTLGLQGLQQAGQAGATLGQLGATEQQSDLARLQAQAAAAGQTRQMDQQRMDMQYADFLRQRDYPMEQLGQFSSLLRGMPMQLGSTQTTYAPPPSMLSQVGGAGLAGLGLYNMMG